jgi:hypothetical protein
MPVIQRSKSNHESLKFSNPILNEFVNPFESIGRRD